MEEENIVYEKLRNRENFTVVILWHSTQFTLQRLGCVPNSSNRKKEKDGEGRNGFCRTLAGTQSFTFDWILTISS